MANINRDYASNREELFNLIRSTYPDVLANFSDASIGSALLEALAFLGDKMSHSVDIALNEANPREAQMRQSLLNSIYRLGGKVRGASAASVELDITATVPVDGDAPDLSYMPVILRGAQVVGGGQSFETRDDIDFLSPLSANGSPDRQISPNYGADRQIVSYDITKKARAISGLTQNFSRFIEFGSTSPFLKITLPFENVIEVTDVITLEGNNFRALPTLSQWMNPANRWEEVNSLAEGEKFLETFTISERPFRRGKITPVPKRFTVKLREDGFTDIIFGRDILPNSLGNIEYSPDEKDFFLLSPKGSLGYRPRGGTTLFVKYRVGGGKSANVGAGAINSFNTATVIVSGQDSTINSEVSSSISVTNLLPSSGGEDEPSVEELREIASSPNIYFGRAISIEDYKKAIRLMPAKFDSPRKFQVNVEGGKIIINLLMSGTDGKLSTFVPKIVAGNLKEWLSFYSSFDHIEISSASIANVGIEITLASNGARGESSQEIREIISKRFSAEQLEIGEGVPDSDIYSLISALPSVSYIKKIRYYVPTGANYSQELLPFQGSDNFISTGQNSGIVPFSGQMLEIKNPSKDIKIIYDGLLRQ